MDIGLVVWQYPAQAIGNKFNYDHLQTEANH